MKARQKESYMFVCVAKMGEMYSFFNKFFTTTTEIIFVWENGNDV